MTNNEWDGTKSVAKKVANQAHFVVVVFCNVPPGETFDHKVVVFRSIDCFFSYIYFVQSAKWFLHSVEFCSKQLHYWTNAITVQCIMWHQLLLTYNLCCNQNCYKHNAVKCIVYNTHWRKKKLVSDPSWIFPNARTNSNLSKDQEESLDLWPGKFCIQSNYTCTFCLMYSMCATVIGWE